MGDLRSGGRRFRRLPTGETTVVNDPFENGLPNRGGFLDHTVALIGDVVRSGLARTRDGSRKPYPVLADSDGLNGGDCLGALLPRGADHLTRIGPRP